MVKKGKNTKKNHKISTRNNNFSTSTSNTNSNPPAKKKKPQSLVLYKRFETFDEAANDILCIPGYIGMELAAKLYSDHNVITVKDMIEAITSLFHDNVPDIENSRNQFWALNTSLDRCFLKTGKFIGISWVINKKYESGAHTIVSVDLTFISYNVTKTADEINFLYDKGWTKEKPE